MADPPDAPLRLRQAVVVARDLEATAERLRTELGLGELYRDPGVAYFGLANAVFALGDTFLEVVSPVREDTSAGRYLERRGGDGGYMLMFQLDDLAAARSRARELGVREVFEVDLDEITEAHLHPADMRGAIVSISRPEPAASWKWGGPAWEQRAVPGGLLGATVAVADPDPVAERWHRVLGAPAADAGIQFTRNPSEPGLIEILVAGDPARAPLEIAGVRFCFTEPQPVRA